MVLLFNYSGSVNGNTLTGFGSLDSDPNSGRFIGGASFSAFPGSFDPGAVGVSLLSISCTNSGKEAYGQLNIIDLANGGYTSTRTVTFSKPDSTPLGSVTISGTFSKIADTLYTAAVTVNGTYSGPTDLILPRGYDMALTPVGNNELDGDFTMNVVSAGGTYIVAQHHQQFVFNNPTQQPSACEINLFYDNNILWNAAQKDIYLAGVSVIRPN
jgi:hypothetical protein